MPSPEGDATDVAAFDQQAPVASAPA